MQTILQSGPGAWWIRESIYSLFGEPNSDRGDAATAAMRRLRRCGDGDSGDAATSPARRHGSTVRPRPPARPPLGHSLAARSCARSIAHSPLAQQKDNNTLNRPLHQLISYDLDNPTPSIRPFIKYRPTQSTLRAIWHRGDPIILSIGRSNTCIYDFS